MGYELRKDYPLLDNLWRAIAINSDGREAGHMTTHCLVRDKYWYNLVGL